MWNCLKLYGILCYNINKKIKTKKMDKNMRSMIPAGAKETLLDLIDEITISLDELRECEKTGTLGLYGEGSKAAFVQMLEFIQQRWEEAEQAGLDFDIESEFPV